MSTYHVMPVILHTDDDCVCQPTVEPVERRDGSYGWLAVHHSFDGREAHEAQR